METRAWEYQKQTKTIRTVPGNHWVASMNSFDGALDHEANARLIAAAPELLEALEWWMRKLGDDSVDDMGEWLEETAVYFRDAIAKAKGE